MTLKSILEILRLLPQIVSLIRAVFGMIKKMQAEKIARDRQLAVEKLQNAKTESEVLNAAENYLDRPR